MFNRIYKNAVIEAARIANAKICENQKEKIQQQMESMIDNCKKNQYF